MYGIWTVVPPILSIIIAMFTKNIILALFVGMCSISVMTSGFDFLGQIGTAMINGIHDNGEILMSFIPIGIMLYFMERGGGFKAFSKWSHKKVNSPTKAKGMALLLSIILSVNDYLANLTVAPIIKPVAKQNKVPTHKIGFIVANTANITSLLPFSMYFLFSAGMVSSILPEIGSGAQFYYKAIWLSFYTMLSILMAVLMVFGILPDIGSMKKHQQLANEYKDDESCVVENEDTDGIKPDFLAFVLPLIGLVVTLAIYSIIQKTIVFLPALWVGCIISIIYPVCRGTYKFSEVSSGIVRGFINQAPVFLILMFAFGFGTLLDGIGFSDYVVTLVGSNITKVIVPLVVFLIASATSYSTGSLGTSLVMMLPIALPLASATGANLYLTFGACYSGAHIGDQTSPIADALIMISGSSGLDPVEFSKAILPYRLIQFGICSVLFLVFGFIL